MIIGCTQGPVPGINMDKSLISINNQGLITQAQAIQMALDATISFSETPKTKGSPSKQISNYYPIIKTSRNKTDTVIHIVNYENDGGFSIITANQKYGGLVAYVEKGQLNPNREDVNEGVQLFLQRLGAYMYYIDKKESNKNKQKEVTRIVPPGPPYTLLRIDTSIAYGNWTTTAFRDTMITMKWGYDRAPFNSNVPNFYNSGPVAIAIAHIMSYHQYPSSRYGHTYNWAGMMTHYHAPIDPSYNPQLANLLSDITSSTNLDITSSAPNCRYYDNFVSRTFVNMGYSVGTLSNYNYANVKASINGGKPVYAAGTSAYLYTTFELLGINFTHTHFAWVIDGYEEEYRTVTICYDYVYGVMNGGNSYPEEVITTYEYGGENKHTEHHNMCSSGMFDGWYSADVLNFGQPIDNGGFTYETNVVILTNIDS